MTKTSPVTDIIVNSDQHIIEQVKSGNINSYKHIVAKYEAQILATVTRMLGSSHEVEDIAQQVFINFYKSIARFRGDAAVSTYLTRIAINLSLNEIKRRKRKSWLSFFGKKEDGNYERQIADPSNNAEQQATKDLVERALERLEPELRSIVVLRLMEGYSTKETAEILNIPLGTVLSRLARGREKLKQIIVQLKDR